jgi:large subunit ribosomal protein L13
VNTLSLRTQIAKPGVHKKEWFVIDAENQVMGRMCTKIATILRGKHKATYTPHVDAGDYVIVLNASKFRLTGNKMMDMDVITYSGYPGGQKVSNAKNTNAKFPTRMIENCVKGMLPKNKLGKAMYKKLYVYEGTEHMHHAQKPTLIK